MTKTWMVRAGQGGYLFGEFKSKNLVAIGWSELGDLTALTSMDSLLRFSDKPATVSEQTPPASRTLEAMNEWIEDTIYSSYIGPDGSILKALDSLNSFLSTISLAIPVYRRGSYRRPRRPYRW